MKWTEKRRDTLDADLDLLLGDLCKNFGICLFISGETLIKKHNPIKASDFATSVLYAEGMDASEYSEFRPSIERAFNDRYGAEVSVDEYES